jgi:hypothetical protein
MKRYVRIQCRTKQGPVTNGLPCLHSPKCRKMKNTGQRHTVRISMAAQYTHLEKALLSGYAIYLQVAQCKTRELSCDSSKATVGTSMYLGNNRESVERPNLTTRLKASSRTRMSRGMPHQPSGAPLVSKRTQEAYFEPQCTAR